MRSVLITMCFDFITRFLYFLSMNENLIISFQATFVILLTASTLVTAKQYIGDPIDCIVEDVPQGVMDTYCWIHSTFRFCYKQFCQLVGK